LRIELFQPLGGVERKRTTETASPARGRDGIVSAMAIYQ
jgi:hypothetical protein